MTQSKDDTITVDLSDYTMDSNSGFITSSNLDSITTISGISTDTIDISDYTTSTDDQISFDWDNMGTIKIDRTMFEDCMPDADRINDMCKEYPALAKAYENFKTVYKLVEQDYKGKKEDEDL